MHTQLSITALYAVLYKWRRPYIALIIIMTILGGLATLVLPKQYLSTATVVPANPQLTDKNFLYNTSIQSINSVYGVEEDLDRLLTSLQLNGNYNAVVDKYKLVSHYNLAPSTKASTQAANILKKQSGIFKTETGAIKINVWDTDPTLAATMANEIVSLTNDRLIANNISINKQYAAELTTMLAQHYTQLDSVDPNILKQNIQYTAIKNAIEKNEATLAQLKLTIATKVPAIVVLEPAYPSNVADKPSLAAWLTYALISSILLGLLLIILAERVSKA